MTEDKKWTQADVDAIKPDEHGHRHFPLLSKFESQCNFGDNCRFGAGCEFGDSCKFGDNCDFGRYCVIHHNCEFGKGCTFSAVYLNDGTMGNTCEIGYDSKFMVDIFRKD